MNSLQTRPASQIGPRRILRPPGDALDQRRGNPQNLNTDQMIFSIVNAAGECIGITCGLKQRALPAPHSPAVHSPDSKLIP